MRDRSIIVALSLALLSRGVLAQSDAPDDTPNGADFGAGAEADSQGRDNAAELLEQPPSSGTVYHAVGMGDDAAAIPGVVLPDYRPASGSLLPEGTYLLRRRGIAVPVGDDRWAFVFDRDAQGEAEPPMYLMASLQLSEMVRLVKSRAETVTFFVDGEVFVFQEHNYLLPIRYDVGAEKDHSRTEEAAATIEANTILRPDDKDPSVESLMERLERASDQQPERAAPPRTAPPAQAGADSLMPEQTPVVSMRGRLVRGERGRWAFLPDNDAEPVAGDEKQQARAFLLQPCLNTQELERLAERHSDRVAFIVSGAVFVFEGRNYLLPTMYLIETIVDGNLTPAQ